MYRPPAESANENPPRFLAVRNFRKFQHYSKRNPPWIKLYSEVLDDYDFARLPDASKAHVMSIWLLASRLDNKIPNDAGWVAAKIGATEPVNLTAFLELGYLVEWTPEDVDHASDTAPLAECKQDASITLAECKQDATPETETEIELETEERESTKGALKRTGKAAPWMSVIRAIYHERYDADPPAQTVKALRGLVERHGIDEVAHRFRIYCERTEGRYFNPFRFAATWGEWERVELPASRAEQAYQSAMEALAPL